MLVLGESSSLGCGPWKSWLQADETDSSQRPLWGTHRNLLREVSWPPFVSSPHPICCKQQPKLSGMELPKGGSQGEGSQGAGRLEVEGTQKSPSSLLRASWCAGQISGSSGEHVSSPTGTPPAHGRVPERTPFKELCSPTCIWCLSSQSSSVMVGLYHQFRGRRDLRKPVVHVPHPLY